MMSFVVTAAAAATHRKIAGITFGAYEGDTAAFLFLAERNRGEELRSGM